MEKNICLCIRMDIGFRILLYGISVHRQVFSYAYGAESNESIVWNKEIVICKF